MIFFHFQEIFHKRLNETTIVYLNVGDSEPDRSFTYEWAIFPLRFLMFRMYFKSWNLNDCKITDLILSILNLKSTQ